MNKSNTCRGRHFLGRFIFVFIFSLFAAQSPSLAKEGEKKAISTLYPTYCMQLSLHNGPSTFQWGPPHEKFVLPQNALCHQFGVQYERVTKHNIILNAGLQYGLFGYSIDIAYDLSNFDPAAVENLKNKMYNGRINTSMSFLKPSIMIGYQFPLNDKLTFSTKAGVSMLLFTGNKFNGNKEHSLTYTTDDGNTTKTELIVYEEDLYKKHHSYRNTRRVSKFDLYFGLQRAYNYKWIKRFAAGIELSTNIRGLYYSRTSVGARPNIAVANKNDFAHDQFTDYHLSIGLRLGVGLWK